jgi:hypothetical protein
MIRTRTTISAGLAALLSLGIASAVSAIGEDEDPQVVYCQSLVDLSAAVDALRAVDTTSTVDDLETAVDDVREAATTFEDSIRNLVESQIAGLETALGELEGYRDSLEGDETIEAAVQGAAAAIGSVGTAREQVGVIPNCAVVAGQEAVEEEPEG